MKESLRWYAWSLVSRMYSEVVLSLFEQTVKFVELVETLYSNVGENSTSGVNSDA